LKRFFYVLALLLAAALGIGKAAGEYWLDQQIRRAESQAPADLRITHDSSRIGWDGRVILENIQMQAPGWPLSQAQAASVPQAWQWLLYRPLPPRLELEIEQLRLPAEVLAAFASPQELAALGLAQIVAEVKIQADLQPGAGQAALAVQAQGKALGQLELRAKIGYPAPWLEQAFNPSRLSLAELELQYQDRALLRPLFELAARRDGKTAPELADALLAQAEYAMRQFGLPALPELLQVGKAALLQSGRLRIELRPAAPLNLAALSNTAPATLPDVLGLKVAFESSPVPP
jgi:hypothetical protein